MARDRPSPYGLRGLLIVARNRPLFTVARGPSRRNFVISAASLQRCPLSAAISRPIRKAPFHPRARENLFLAIPLDRPMHGAAQDRALRTKRLLIVARNRHLLTVARGPLRRNVVISAASLQRCPLSLAISRPPKTPLLLAEGNPRDRSNPTAAPAPAPRLGHPILLT